MPYIKQWDMIHVDSFGAKTPGELNYAITRLLVRYLAQKGLDYQAINDVNGALEGAKMEFNRRVTAPYEDRKIKDNGDVYPKEVT